MNTRNPVVHFELPAENDDRMTAFYSGAFGWQTQKLGPEFNGYILVSTTETTDDGRPTSPGAINGGIYNKAQGMPNHPSIVIAVEDLDASIQLVNQNGGKVIGEPSMIPGVGRFVYFEDTEGNVSGMLEPEEMG